MRASRAFAAAGAAVVAVALLAPPINGASARGPGGPYDLGRPNDAFFDHLRRYTFAASTRGIVTIVALYNAWMNNGREGWALNPFNPRNNVNWETEALTSEDLFMRELGHAVEGDRSTATRRFLRDVWMTLVQNVARNTPDATMLQPLSEAFKDAGEFGKSAFYERTAEWWGKGNLVDNVRNLEEQPVASATYADVHDSRENLSLLRTMTIANTDDTCVPPASSVIARMSRAAVARRSNYLVYDCDVRGSDWNARVLEAIRHGIGGRQPPVTVGSPEGALVGYGFPDIWVNLAASGRAEEFMDELRQAGGNLTFVLIVLNPSVGGVTAWQDAEPERARPESSKERE